MSPWWYFIPFILVPILVHLFDFRKARRIYFSSVKYIVQLTSKTKSKSRLKYFVILSNRILIFASLIVVIVLLLGRREYLGGSGGQVGVHYDNSISSTLNNADLKVEQGVQQIIDQENSILFFDNSRKTLLDNNSIVSISDSKTQQSINLVKLFNLFDQTDVTSHFLFSDFQAINTLELKQYMIDSTRNYHLILTNDLNRLRNVSVDSLYLMPNQENLSEVSVLVDFNVQNMTNGSLVVKLMKGARQLSSVVKDISELDAVRFDISKENYGDFEIVIDGDDVNYDNTFHFTIGEKLKSRITIIDSKRAGILMSVYDNKELFDVTVQESNNLDYDVLKGSDLIVISDQFSIAESLRNQLDDSYFIVFPSDSVDISSYEDFVKLNLKPIDEYLSETSIDSEHPLFKGVFEQSIENGSMPVGAGIFEISGNYEPIIEFRGGNAFLLRVNQIYFFNTSLKSSSGGIQSNPLFLPILYQIAFSSTGNVETPYYYPGNRLVVSATPSDIPIKLIKENYEIIPSFNSNGSQVILELPDELEPGKYALVQNLDTLKNIAINTPKLESLMTSPDFEELQSTFSELQNVSVSEISDQPGNVVFASSSQSSLWKYALILTLFLILTETVLHRYLR